MELKNRRPPQDEEAELSVIGGLLFNGRSTESIQSIVNPSDFMDPKHEAIYAAMIELDRKSSPVDLVTVADEMRRRGSLGKLGAVGGEAYLSELANRMFTTENIGRHAEIVRDKSRRRQIAIVASRMLDAAYGDRVSTAELISNAQVEINTVAQATLPGKPVRLRQNLTDTENELKRLAELKKNVTGVPTGITAFDDMTCGFQPAELIVIGARPGVGKTAFAMTTALYAARNGFPVLVFSLEMARQALGKRILANLGNINAKNIRRADLNADEWLSVMRVVDRSADYPLWIDDTRPMDMTAISTKARIWRDDRSIFPNGNELGIIIIDYVQMVEPFAGQKNELREQKVSAIVGAMQTLARQLNLPVIAIAALNRDSEKRPDKRPIKSDLRESGRLESDADLVAFLYRDEKDKNAVGMVDAEIIIDKQRNGATGTVRVGYQGEFLRFVNLANPYG